MLQAASALLLGVTAARGWPAPPPPPLDPELALVKSRFVATLSIHTNISGNEADARAALAQMNPATGTFKDLNYSFAPYAHIGQPQSEHLIRCNLFGSLSISPGSKYCNSSTMAASALTCLEWYIDNNPVSTNWFMNQIWVPIFVGQLAILFEKQLPAPMFDKALGIMGQVDEKGPKNKGAGANAANVGRVHIMLGLIQGNKTAVASGYTAFNKDIHTNAYGPPLHSGQGIRPDYSFMQHGPLLYNGLYGVSYAQNLLRVAYQTAGTSFAMSADAYNIMSNFLLNGTQQMILYPSLNWDISVIGRAYSSPGGQRSSIGDLAWMIAEVGGSRGREWAEFAGRLNHSVGDLPDSSHFWDYANYVTHHRKGEYTVTLRMIDTETLSSETIGGGGLVGFHLGDGATFVYKSGEEYFDIFPCWDWQLVPGTTVEYGASCPVDAHVGHYGATSVVGGVSDGMDSVATWQFRAPSFPADAKKGQPACVQSLRFRRTTVLMDAAFVVLTAGMRSNTSSPVVTTLDSRALNGAVTYWASVGDVAVGIPRGTHAPMQIAMLHHDGIGYLFPSAASVAVTNDAVTGNWSRLATLGSGSPTRDLFTATVRHGAALSGAQFVYAVFPSVAVADFPSAARRFLAATTVVSNTEAAQVLHASAGAAGGELVAGTIFDNATSVTAPSFGRVALFQSATAAFVLRRRPAAAPGGNATMTVAISDPAADKRAPKGTAPALVLTGVKVAEAVTNSYHVHNAPAYCSMNASTSGAAVGNFINGCGKQGGVCFQRDNAVRASESFVTNCTLL